MNDLIGFIVLTWNEEPNLPTLLASLRPLNAPVLVVDSGSTDRTVDIARSYGAVVLSHPFENAARQLNWAIDHCPFDVIWLMRMDADERLTPELVNELLATLATVPPDITGFWLKCRVYFWGRWIRHGDMYPLWLLRVWRRGHGRCEDRWMDEHFVLGDGQAGRLRHDIIDENQKGLGFWVEKHNRYADREIKDALQIDRGHRTSGKVAFGKPRRRRWAKENLYYRSPPFLRAFLYWTYRYVLRLGFLDGTAGFVFHFLQGFFYRFLIDAKLHEMRLGNREREGSGPAPPPRPLPTHRP